MEMMRAMVDSSSSAVTSTSTTALALRAPLNTSAPTPLSCGTDSPVTGASSNDDDPATIRPSRGTRSPASTRMTWPSSTSATATSDTAPSSPTTCAVGGARLMSSLMELDVLRIDQPSSHSPTWSRKMTMAASPYAPSRMPPITAMDMRTFMSAVLRLSDATAMGSMNTRPQMAATT